MKYKIIVKLSDGNEIHANVESGNQEEAIGKIMKAEPVVEFMKDGQEIVSINIKIADEQPSKSSYVLQKSEKEGWWVVTDTEALVVIRWKEGQFNETFEITNLSDDNLDALSLAKTNREITEWLFNNHRELFNNG